jgi:disulfide bond formation protein DsbB
MTPLAQNITDFLSACIVAADILIVFLILVLLVPQKNTGWRKDVVDFFRDFSIELAFLTALAGFVASLFYSNIVGFQPCLLCIWQRIFLYPQVVILGIALLKKDNGVRKYAIALSAIGAAIATYHTYLQFGGTSVIPCSVNGVGCEHVYFLEFGYVTIPTMALTAFALIIVFLLFTKKEN